MLKIITAKSVNEILHNVHNIDSIAKIIICFELVLNIFVITTVPYTEIDWKAYMQEVEGYINGTADYSKLKGDTGPLVYPAGFVYLFSLFYFITERGENIKRAQWIYVGLYLITIYLLYRIYRATSKVPPYVLLISCCISYRIHSIFLLRLFNDPVAVLLLYLSINLFLQNKWTLGSIVYSLAVSIKMNILLYSPALLFIYLFCLGIPRTFKQLCICASVQYALSMPFILANYKAYVGQSFNLTRIFLYQWTVNWKFLPEYLFLNRGFHVMLFCIHIALLICFVPSWYYQLCSYAKLQFLETRLGTRPYHFRQINACLRNQLVILPLFTCNFIGVICSRSLHYQFYVWYYHTLPYLLWHTPYSDKIRLTILGVIELCWNIYPSDSYSSITLLGCHLAILYGLFVNRYIPNISSLNVYIFYICQLF